MSDAIRPEIQELISNAEIRPEIQDIIGTPVDVDSVGTISPLQIPLKEFFRGKSSKEIGRAVITAGQLSAGFTPIGRVSLSAAEGVGEFLKSQLKGEPIIDSLKKAGTATAITAILGASGALVKKAGGVAVKSRLGEKFSEEIGEKILKNPGLAIPTKKTIGKVNREGFESIKELKREMGKVIGIAKKEAGETASRVKVKNIAKFVESEKKRIGLIVEKGEEVSKPSRAAKLGFKEIDSLLKSKTKQTFSNIQTRLDNLDESRPMQTIYDKLSDPTKTLTKSEKSVLAIRNKIRDEVEDSVSSVLTKNNLRKEKELFTKLSRSLEDPQLKRGMKNQDAFGSVVKSSLNEGKEGLLKKLTELQELTNTKFLDNTIKNVAGKQIARFSTSQRGDLGTLATGLSGRVGRTLIQEAPLTSTALRRGAVELGTKQVPPQSINELLYGEQ